MYIYVTLPGTAKLFSPISSEWEFLLFYIVSNTQDYTFRLFFNPVGMKQYRIVIICSSLLKTFLKKILLTMSHLLVIFGDVLVHVVCPCTCCAVCLLSQPFMGCLYFHVTNTLLITLFQILIPSLWLAFSLF